MIWQRLTQFAVNNFLDVLVTDASKQLQVDALIGILKSINVAYVQEEDIFDAISKWVRYAESARVKDFKRLMQLLRLARI